MRRECRRWLCQYKIQYKFNQLPGRGDQRSEFVTWYKNQRTQLLLPEGFAAGGAIWDDSWPIVVKELMGVSMKDELL